MKKNILFCFFILFLFNPFFTFSQVCDSLVPSFVVDLSSKADSLWTSPAIQRAGSCCGNTPSCVEFEVTISSMALGVVVDIVSGAVAGTLYVSIDCNTPVPFGDTIFFPSTGPHSLSFCKPGTSVYQYSLRSIPGTTTNIFNYELQSPIAIYPNPASDGITIKSNLYKIQSYHIIDLVGKLIQNGTLENDNKIDIQNIPVGFYFIECFAENKIYRQKIVKE